MIKKILFIILLLTGLFNLTFASSWIDTIKNEGEYININIKDGFFEAKEFISNFNNDYYVLGQFYYKEIASLNDYELIIKNQGLLKSTLFLINGTNVMAIDKTKKPDISKCKKLTLNVLKYFNSFSDKEKLVDYQNKLIGNIVDPNIQCYYYDNVLYFTNNLKSKLDLKYIYDNYLLIDKKIKPIISGGTQYDKLKSIYKFVMDNTDYNYDALKLISGPESTSQWKDYFPFRVGSFFEGKKIVCEGYAKTTVFLNNLFGIKSQIVDGETQPIENSSVALSGIGHAWVKVGDYYYDNTFDDNDAEISYDYFQKDKTCFNLDHYMTGWVMFNSTHDRYNYIKQNLSHLLKTCPEITKNSILKDDMIIPFLKHTLENYSLDTNKKMSCSFVKFCDLKGNSNKELINELKYSTLTVYGTATTEEKTINLGKEFSGLNPSTKLTELDIEVITVKPFELKTIQKIQIKAAIDAYKVSLSKKYSEETKNLKVYELKIKVNNILNNKTLTEKTKVILEYLYEIL